MDDYKIIVEQEHELESGPVGRFPSSVFLTFENFATKI